MPDADSFLSSSEKDKIVSTIKRSEKLTSGEIKVHVENHCKGDPFSRAIFWFNKLKLNLTERRNGIIIYIAIHDKKIAIAGDIGINEKVSKDFWDNIIYNMKKSFAEGHFATGLEKAILECGMNLKLHFPSVENDVNELSDDISIHSN